MTDSLQRCLRYLLVHKATGVTTWPPGKGMGKTTREECVRRGWASTELVVRDTYQDGCVMQLRAEGYRITDAGIAALTGGR